MDDDSPGPYDNVWPELDPRPDHRADAEITSISYFHPPCDMHPRPKAAGGSEPSLVSNAGLNIDQGMGTRCDVGFQHRPRHYYGTLPEFDSWTQKGPGVDQGEKGKACGIVCLGRAHTNSWVPQGQDNLVRGGIQFLEETILSQDRQSAWIELRGGIERHEAGQRGHHFTEGFQCRMHSPNFKRGTSSAHDPERLHSFALKKARAGPGMIRPETRFFCMSLAFAPVNQGGSPAIE